MFIKPSRNFVREYRDENLAPMFRKKFYLKETAEAFLEVCALGYGYFYINSEKVTPDLFISAVSDYRKTLWVHRYDVTPLLKKGENVLAAVLGNGFYNETFKTPWKHYLAEWRDVPKLALRLEVNGETVLRSDETFRCCPESAVTFNQLRSGECFDARLYDKNWKDCGYDDSTWEYAVADGCPPSGKFRLCECEPIRECGEYPAVCVRQTGKQRYLFDIGQNISGYVRLRVCEPAGTVLTLRHAEEIDENGDLKLNGLDVLYPEVPFQTDRVICDGNPLEWHPLFTYHGFRYVEVDGFTSMPDRNAVTGVFVHQDVERLSEFSCSDPVLNKIYEYGILSTYSNLHYALTDCPTREKLGWLNDAQASAEQMCINFNIDKFFGKWMVDICDSMRPNGMMPGVAPTPDWGYDNGSVADGALFEIPYRVYLYTGKTELLKESYPYFLKYLEYFRQCEREKVRFPLADWNGLNNMPTPGEMITQFYGVKFCAIAAETADLLGDLAAGKLREEYLRRKTVIGAEYLMPNGRCCVNEQTAVAMMIVFGVYKEIGPLAAQLEELMHAADDHFSCGMVGMQYILDALTICGKTDLAMAALTAEGAPGFRDWIDRGATTLWETWRDKFTDSRNHHMFSCVLAWMFKVLGGIRVAPNGKGFAEVEIDPHFAKGIDRCTAARKTETGSIRVSWSRGGNGNIDVHLEIPRGVKAVWHGQTLAEGKNNFSVGG